MSESSDEDRARQSAETFRMLAAVDAAERLEAAETEWARARVSYRQAVVALYRIDRFSQAEIARLVGRSQSSISNLLRNRP
ncbi:MAG: helix-turn-helix domain-containing protein [bacterium]|nr:helix-turn-helix domain-containing protein [bacterium]MDE0353213.1 helix-turn-helix domain-containing protein [bacterium]